jgi:hypothetical protein
LQGDAEVSENLLSLRSEVVPSNQFAVAIERGLAGYEDHSAGLHLDNL